jgi:hypothetical protein
MHDRDRFIKHFIFDGMFFAQMEEMEDFMSLKIYACLPFVELAHEATIRIGPVSFWPSSKFRDFIEPSHVEAFQEYVGSIGHIKARAKMTDNEMRLVTTVRLPPQGITCISIDEQVDSSQHEFALIDALYLLYFACTFRDLYYTNEIPSFGAFRKLIPASLDFILNKDLWKDLHIHEIHREETVCIHLFDQEICEGLGQALSVIYSSQNESSKSPPDNYKRLIRSIRYLVDRFFQRFVNLFDRGLQFPEGLFEPEDVIFLASSFEALFDINDRQVTADFKHKLRPLLHLKYSKPLELFWKWTDDFYEVKRKIVHGGITPDPFFRANPNFEISHILIGIKLLIYSVYYTLFKYGLIHSDAFDSYTPPDFKWIHPEEILLFFWTESSLLRKLALFIQQWEMSDKQEESKADIHLLSNLFISMYERYYKQGHRLNDGITFIPTPVEEIQKHISSILEVLEKNQISSFSSFVPPELPTILKERLQGSN